MSKSQKKAKRQLVLAINEVQSRGQTIPPADKTVMHTKGYRTYIEEFLPVCWRHKFLSG